MEDCSSLFLPCLIIEWKLGGVSMTSNLSVRWQLKLLPLMRAALVLMAIYFFVASLLQYQQVYQDISQQPTSSLRSLESARGDPDAVRFRTMVALEQDVMALRYRHLNATLLLRTWTRYTGFLVGMLLALTGGFFILGRLKEDPTHLAAEGGGARFDLATQSPGIVLAILGTALMMVTIWVRFDIELRDKPVYVLPWGLERNQATSGPKESPSIGAKNPKEIPLKAAKISPTVDDPPLPPDEVIPKPNYH